MLSFFQRPVESLAQEERYNGLKLQLKDATGWILETRGSAVWPLVIAVVSNIVLTCEVTVIWLSLLQRRNRACKITYLQISV